MGIRVDRNPLRFKRTRVSRSSRPRGENLFEGKHGRMTITTAKLAYCVPSSPPDAFRRIDGYETRHLYRSRLHDDVSNAHLMTLYPWDTRTESPTHRYTLHDLRRGELRFLCYRFRFPFPPSERYKKYRRATPNPTHRTYVHTYYVYSDFAIDGSVPRRTSYYRSMISFGKKVSRIVPILRFIVHR